MSHDVAFGIYLSHSNEYEALLRLIAKKHEMFLTLDGHEYKIFLHDDVFTDDHLLIESDGSLSILENVLDEFIFFAKCNPKIKIGKANFCANMIYLGSHDHSEEKPSEIDEAAVTDLIGWKSELIKQGRLDPNAKLGLVGNCCS